jgi:hypothetical protein
MMIEATYGPSILAIEYSKRLELASRMSFLTNGRMNVRSFKILGLIRSTEIQLLYNERHALMMITLISLETYSEVEILLNKVDYKC